MAKDWAKRIIACHTAVTNRVSHRGRMKSDRYFVWQEDGADDLILDGTHGERAVTGTTDLFTKLEFDPWAEEFEAAMDAAEGIDWELISVQHEHKTGMTHYEWTWSVM